MLVCYNWYAMYLPKEVFVTKVDRSKGREGVVGWRSLIHSSRREEKLIKVGMLNSISVVCALKRKAKVRGGGGTKKGKHLSPHGLVQKVAVRVILNLLRIEMERE